MEYEVDTYTYADDPIELIPGEEVACFVLQQTVKDILEAIIGTEPFEEYSKSNLHGIGEY
ncbi:hypothetical protein DMJ13_22090 [halophilic archaeon]|nr:hypothetical protein DMJ13_22090 [halophilic archaeon]